MDRSNDPANGLVTSRDWTLERLLASGPRFRTVDGISANSGTPEQIASRIKDYEQRNVPLVVQDLHHHPDWPEFFTPQWLETHHGSQMVEVRNMHGERVDRELSLTELIDSLRNAPRFAQQDERERFYGKDIHCPADWRTWVKTSRVLPDVIKPGATGDILPETVETLMSYLGVSDTFTPLHKDPCASYGQNIMCYTEDGGSSFWFMTSPSDCTAITDYFRQLGHELDWEDHIATLEELVKAPFDVYIWEQKIGDLILVPPRSFHQVINAGGITIKVSWSRMSIKSLEVALYHELPVYRRVCRPEIYRVKRTIYDTLVQRTTALQTLVYDTPDSTSESVNPLCKEVARLIELLDDVLEQEYSTQHRRLRQVTNSFAPGGHGDVCDFCGADIFLSSFQCDSCSSGGGSEDPICLCPTCVVEGRMCKCRNMEPVQSGSFKELLRGRNNAMIKLREAHEAGFYEEEPEVLSDQHLIESATTTFQAAWLLVEKKRDILNTQKTTRTCTLVRKDVKSHVVDGWAIIMCKECHAGRCFTHILGSGIHSSVALMTVDLDKTYGRWHLMHRNHQKRYETAVPGLLWATKLGDKTAIDHRLVYFARTFQTPRPLSNQVTLGFYDKKLPDPEEVDQLDHVSVEASETMDSRTRVQTPIQHLSYRLDSGSPAVSSVAGETSRKRKRPSETPNLEPEPDRPSQPQPLTDDRASERLSQKSKPSKRLIMDCVLITTLPPMSRRKPALPETSEDNGRSQARTKTRGREKRQGKQREVTSNSRVSVRSGSRSLVDETMRSQSHSVSSIRRPLFEPETSPQVDSDPIEVEESDGEFEPDEIGGSDDEIPFSFVSHRRKRIESGSPVSPADLPPSSSPLPSPHPEKQPYYAVVNIKHRLPGTRIRSAPHQREIAKTQASIYRLQAHHPVAGPSHQTTRVGPPKRQLPKRPEPKLRPVTELHPPRPPPPPPGLAALEVRIEARINAFTDENQKLRDELLTVRSELAATKNDLTAALTQVGAMERELRELETLEPKFEDLKKNYEQLAALLRGDHLFNSEKFRTATRTEVKSNLGYYFPSLSSDLRAHLWKELPEPVKIHVEKEIGKVADDAVRIRSDIVALQQNSTTGGGIHNGDPAITELRQAIERIEKKHEELEAAISNAGRAQEFERPQHASTSSDSRPTPNNTGNMLPPNLPSKPPPWEDKPQQSPHRRGAQTPPAASDQNSYPVHQGPDDVVNDPVQTGPTQDPRRNPALSRSSSTLPPTFAHSFHPGPIPSSSQYTTFHAASERPPPSISAPPTPTLPQSSHIIHSSCIAELEPGELSPTIPNSSQPSVVAAPIPISQPSPPIRPVHMPRFESTPFTPTNLRAGMHPERSAFPSANNRPSSAVTPLQPLPYASTNSSQQHLPEERLADRSRPLSTFLPDSNATVLPRDGPAPSSSRVTLDDPVTSLASGFPNLVSFPTSFNPNDQHIPTQADKKPNQSPNQSKEVKAAQKRKASEALPSSLPPKPQKMGRVERGEPGNGNDTGGPGVPRAKSKLPKELKLRLQKKKGKGRPNGQLPGPSNQRRG